MFGKLSPSRERRADTMGANPQYARACLVRRISPLSHCKAQVIPHVCGHGEPKKRAGSSPYSVAEMYGMSFQCAGKWKLPYSTFEKTDSENFRPKFACSSKPYYCVMLGLPLRWIWVKYYKIMVNFQNYRNSTKNAPFCVHLLGEILPFSTELY